MAIFSSYVSLPEGKPTQVLQGLRSQDEPSSMDHQTLTLAPSLGMIGHGSLWTGEPRWYIVTFFLMLENPILKWFKMAMVYMITI